MERGGERGAGEKVGTKRPIYGLFHADQPRSILGGGKTRHINNVLL